MTRTSSSEWNAEGTDDATDPRTAAGADQESGDSATVDTAAPSMLAETAQSESVSPQVGGNVALPEEFARSPHQWSLPAYGPTSDAAVYRQIVGYLGPPPLRKPPRGLVMGCGVMVTLLVALVGLSGFYALRLARAQVSQRESAVSVAATIALFCEAAQNRDYSGAYHYLSPAFQGQMSVDAFVAANETHDETNGPITSCTSRTDLLHASISGAHTNVTLEVARGQSVVGTITLTRDADGWRIDTLDPMLELD